MSVRERPVWSKGRMMKILSMLFCFLIVLSSAASDQEDIAADAVIAAVAQARQAAHLSKLESMGRNTFRQKVCQQDNRMPSGWINSVDYRTSDPSHLPESAQRLATQPDTSKIAARLGVGVCIVPGGSVGQPRYSVLVAIYESRWTSFWRIFWE
jgi:hypothetical protein